MRINWHLKAKTFNFLDRAPAGDHLYYLLQRHVTKSVPRKLSPTRETGVCQIAHANTFKAQGVDLSQSYLMEFGAGWDLYSNMILYAMGVGRQCTIDVRRWAKAEAINAVIRHLQVDPPEGAVRVPQRLVRDASLDDDLRTFYGIDYRAPADASDLPEADGTFDLIVTTSVLEHIPADILDNIMRECSRVSKPGGWMSHEIDYSDHYANADPTINHFNFLRFSEEEWRRYNPSIHYQNRLRSPHYTALFEKHGFEIVSFTNHQGSVDALRSIPVAACFAGLSFEEQRDLNGNYLLRKPLAPRHGFHHQA